MRQWTFGIVILGTVMAESTATADRAPGEEIAARPGFDLGLRFGWGVPFGSASDNPPTAGNAVVSSIVPVTVDAGYRIDHRFGVGLFLQYGIGQISDSPLTCQTGFQCSGAVVVTGARGTFRVPLSGPVVLWLGLGGGYEWLRYVLSGQMGNGFSRVVGLYRGAVFGLAQIGGDYHLTPALALGPTVEVSVGRYDNLAFDSTLNGMPSSESMTIPGKAFHGWLTIGLRGVFHL